MNDLKPCPWCRLEPRPTADVDMRPEYKGHIYGYTILCEPCGISMSDEDYETVADAWNERVSAGSSIREDQKMAYVHASDCSLHNEPDSPSEPCDCMSLQNLAAALDAVLWMAEEWFEHNGSNQAVCEGYRSAIEHAKTMRDGALARV